MTLWSVAVWRRWWSGRRRAWMWVWLLRVPVGGGPTTPLIPVPTPNFARNSPTTISNFEFRSLELQRFQPLLKLLPIELRATFLEGRPCHRPRAPQPDPLIRVYAPQARQNSPCSPPSAPTREIVRPAHTKHPKISVFSPAGRTLSRSHPESRPAGRVFSRP